MAKKTNFYPHKMIGIHLLLAFLLLLSGFASASPKKSKIYIVHKFDKGDKVSEAVANYLEDKIAEALQDQYPCADVLIDRDLAAALNFNRERALLGGQPYVAVNGNEYTISFIVPEIAGGIMVRDWTLTASGQCGSPVSKHENQSGKWPLQAVSGEAKGKIDPKNPDVLSGTQTLRPNLLFFPGGNETTTITWNLKFIRGQSAQKKKE